MEQHTCKKIDFIVVSVALLLVGLLTIPVLNRIVSMGVPITGHQVSFPRPNAVRVKSTKTPYPYSVSSINIPAISTTTAATDPALTQFIQRVRNGTGSQVVGIYAKDVFALQVKQQPVNDPSYVATQSGVVTQFYYATLFDVIGFLAHNYASGSSFYQLNLGQSISAISGDGTVHEYRVSSIQDYQAVEPSNVQSDFIDLSSGERLSAGDLFAKIYVAENGQTHLVLQTCLARNGNSSWGRHFVVAQPAF
jgi:hypothetical protein